MFVTLGSKHAARASHEGGTEDPLELLTTTASDSEIVLKGGKCEAILHHEAEAH